MRRCYVRDVARRAGGTAATFVMHIIIYTEGNLSSNQWIGEIYI